MLCDACQRIVQGRVVALGWTNFHKPLQRVFAHHSKTFMIETAAGQGCIICNIVWAHFSESEKDLARQAASQSSLRLFSNPLRRWRGLNELDLGWYGWFPHTREPRIVFIFGIYASKVVEIALLGVDKQCIQDFRGRYDIRPWLGQYDEMMGNKEDDMIPVERIFGHGDVSKAIDSVQNFDLLGSWLGVCNPEDERHQHCHSGLKLATSGVPSRLLDVAAGESGQDIRVSLSHLDREPLPYLTLSHPWGPNPDLQSMPLLSKWKIEHQALEIPFESFPQLFRHAINITRRLGYRYIWIDTFCIIQGDQDDFLRESAVMGEIYQHGALNLAAGAAVNSHSPLEYERNISLVKPFRTNVNWSSVPGESKLSKSQSYFVLDKDFLSENLQKTRINRRAWVLQEQTLAPRVLHFGKHQLFWKCRNSQFCETYPFGIPDLPISTFEDLLGPLGHRRIEARDALKWLAIAERYSDCGLTRLSDKLIAISGIARAFHARTLRGEQTYVAGIWSGRLVLSLLWHVLDGRQWNEESCKRPEPVDYMAPSWSWASVCGKLKFPVDSEASQESFESSKETVVELLEYSVDPLDPQNPYGRVTDGLLKLSGLLRPASDFYWIFYVTTEKANDRNYNARQAIFGFSTIFIDCIFDDIRDYDRRKQSTFIPGSSRLTDAFFLPLIMRSAYQLNFSTQEQMPAVEGILVAPVEGKPDEYVRIGYFKSRRDDNNERMIEVFRGGTPSEFILR